MRWTRKPRTPKDKTKWHWWFAWHPVKMEQASVYDPIVRVWLERVERKGTRKSTCGGERIMWDYRAIDEGEASK